MKSTILFLISCIVILFAKSCNGKFDAQTSNKAPVATTDSQFSVYVQEFESYYGQSVSNIPISFADLDPKIAGICYRFIIDNQTINAYIVIDRKYWYTISGYQRINLIFHELGHCAMNRKHIPSDSVGICPTSLMFEQIMNTSCIKDNYNIYMKELFNE